MKKNISSLLQRGNLTPKERFLLLIHNEVSEDRDNKSILTEADKHALTNWTPRDDNETKEYNRYNEGWRLTGFAELDAQTTYLKATNSLLRAGRLLDILVFSDTPASKKDAIKTFFKFSKSEGLDYHSEKDILKGVSVFLKERSFTKDYTVLLAFKEIFKRLSKVYKTDLTYNIDNWISEFKDDIEELNGHLCFIASELSDKDYKNNKTFILNKGTIKDMLIDLSNAKPDKNKIQVYEQRFKGIFGGEF